MATPISKVTIHMAASLDGFIARKDGSTGWLETSDEYADGESMDPEFVIQFLKTIDCYVMGSRTYETALDFEKKLKPDFASIWVVGGGAVAGETLRRGLADEVRYSIMPVLIGSGISFFEGLDKDVALHLLEVKAYKSGMVALRHEIRR